MITTKIVWVLLSIFSLKFYKMANPAQEALKKLEEQLNCPICLDTYSDPKLLPCNHVYCRKCLVKLVIRDQQGELSLTCPHCRRVTPIPHSGVAGLQAAFHINYLLEIQDSLQKLKVAPATVEGAVGRDGSSLNPVWKASYCSEHPERELELYCEPCEKLICFHCAIKGGSHHTHDHKLLDKAYENYSKEIISSFEPMEKQLTTISIALAQLDIRCGEVTDQQATIETYIHDTMRKLREILYARETSLIGRLHQMTRDKLKKLAVQKDQLETTQAQLSSCFQFMRESLKTSNHEEVLKMKTTVVKQVKELTTTFQPSTLQPSAEANLIFLAHDDFSTTCQNFGELSTHNLPSPTVGPEGAVAHFSPTLIIDELSSPWGITGGHKGELLISEGEGHCISVFSRTGEKLRSFGTYGSSVGQLNTPRGMAVDSEGNVLVVDRENHRIQKFTASGQFLTAVGTKGSGPLQFDYPKDVIINPKNDKVYIVDENDRVQILNSDLTFFGTFGTGQLSYPCGIAFGRMGNVYVADSGNRRIQVFTAEGEVIRKFRGFNSGRMQTMPIGIAVDTNGLVYTTDYCNHCVSVVTSEGQFVTSFGRYGHGGGEFVCPGSLAIVDKVLYVCGRDNDRVQAFSLSLLQ